MRRSLNPSGRNCIGWLRNSAANTTATAVQAEIRDSRLICFSFSRANTIKGDHATHPDRGRHVAGDYIGGVVNAQVNPGEANSSNQQHCTAPDAYLGYARFDPVSNESSQHSIKAERKQRMPAGKAVSMQHRHKERRGALAVEGILQ